jgi:hypothetical protein
VVGVDGGVDASSSPAASSSVGVDVGVDDVATALVLERVTLPLGVVGVVVTDAGSIPAWAVALASLESRASANFAASSSDKPPAVDDPASPDLAVKNPRMESWWGAETPLLVSSALDSGA